MASKHQPPYASFEQCAKLHTLTKLDSDYWYYVVQADDVTETMILPKNLLKLEGMAVAMAPAYSLHQLLELLPRTIPTPPEMPADQKFVTLELTLRKTSGVGDIPKWYICYFGGYKRWNAYGHFDDDPANAAAKLAVYLANRDLLPLEEPQHAAHA